MIIQAMRLLTFVAILVAIASCRGTEPEPAPALPTYTVQATFESSAHCSCCNHGYVCDTSAASLSSSGVIHFKNENLTPATMVSVTGLSFTDSLVTYTSARVGDSLNLAFCQVSGCVWSLALSGRIAGDSIRGKAVYSLPGGSNSQSYWGTFVARRSP